MQARAEAADDPRADESPEGVAWPVRTTQPARRLAGGRSVDSLECLIEEVPVALVYNGISHAVMLATPADLEDFALGFSLSEGILASPAELYDCEVVSVAEGIEVRLDIASARLAELQARRRSLAGRTGCGLCGVDSLRAAMRQPAPVPPRPPLSTAALQRALEALPAAQPLFQATGAAHAAAWARNDGRLVAVREDVGRHNALDKLIGHLARQRFDPAAGCLLVTSRASYEMVQKAASVGIGFLAALSAPTTLAARLAESVQLTLVGRARAGRLIAYSHPQQLRENDPMDTDNLIKMANQIARFFEAWPDQAAARQEVASHLARFWDPRMRAALFGHLAAGHSSDVRPLVAEAVAMLKANQGT